MTKKISVCAVIQNDGKMLAQGLLFAASFKKHKNKKYDLFLCCPVNSSKWSSNVQIKSEKVLGYLKKLGVNVNFFDNQDFGSDYPHSNKAYAFATLPSNQEFIFFDTDYLFVDDISDLEFDFDRPDFIRGPRSWPPLNRTKHGLEEIWGQIYDILGVDKFRILRDEFDVNSWDRYPYYNASLIYYRDPQVFSRVYLENMKKIWASEQLFVPKRFFYPQLDQIVLPATASMLGIDPKIYRFQHKKRLRWLHYHDFPYLHFYRKNFDFVSFVHSLLEDDPELGEILMEIPEFAYYFEENMGSTLINEAITWDKDINLRHIKDHLQLKGLWLNAVK